MTMYKGGRGRATGFACPRASGGGPLLPKGRTPNCLGCYLISYYGEADAIYHMSYTIGGDHDITN